VLELPMVGRLPCRGNPVLLDNRRFRCVLRTRILLGNSSTVERRTLTPLI
jgi:hypothetical protein